MIATVQWRMSHCALNAQISLAYYSPQTLYFSVMFAFQCTFLGIEKMSTVSSMKVLTLNINGLFEFSEFHCTAPESSVFSSIVNLINKIRGTKWG